MPTAKLHDGSTLEIEVQGEGPTLLLPVNPRPLEGEQADELRAWGADPALGYSLIAGLRDAFRVVAFDYEGQVLQQPKPETLTPANIAADLLAIADAVQAERFAYYGYSWLAAVGLQLALRTERLSALAMGGYPPLDGPYKEMMSVTNASHALAVAAAVRRAQAPSEPEPTVEPGDWSNVQMTLTPDQTQQFVTLYQALQGFDDRHAQRQLTCPRLCFVGSADEIEYSPEWGDVLVSMAAPVIRNQTELEALGWRVHICEGLNHLQTMQASQVLPLLRPWLLSVLTVPHAHPS